MHSLGKKCYKVRARYYTFNTLYTPIKIFICVQEVLRERSTDSHPHILPEYSTGKEYGTQKKMRLPNKHQHTTSNAAGISKQNFNNVLVIGIKFRQK